MKTKLLLSAFLGVFFGFYSLTEAQTIKTIVAWTFDNKDSIPVQGKGRITPIGGTIRTFDKTGITPFTASPDGTADDNNGWAYNTTNYPQQGSNPKTAGVVIKINAADYKSLSIKADVRPSSSSPRNMALQYSTDSINWFTATTFETPDVLPNGGNANLWYPRDFDLKSITAINNKPTLYLRYVTDFATGQNQYVPVTTKTYAPTCAIRFDNITIKGTYAPTAVETVTMESAGLTQKGRLIEFTQPSTQILNVYSTNGMLIASYPEGTTAIQLAVPNGVYLLKYGLNMFKIMIH